MNREVGVLREFTKKIRGCSFEIDRDKRGLPFWDVDRKQGQNEPER